ncbi:MAG: hypothetical protein FJ134_13025 [Deltaproteobacteria bacterium]|nr:hypothetical protein [Deltaproteobacteria bacterium]
MESARFISPAKDANLQHLAARLAKSSRVGIDTRFSRDSLVVRGDPDKLQEITVEHPEIACARAVFRDLNGHEIVLTDEVHVKFAEGLTEEQRRKLIQQLNCRVTQEGPNLEETRKAADLSGQPPYPEVTQEYKAPTIRLAPVTLPEPSRHALPVGTIWRPRGV